MWGEILWGSKIKSKQSKRSEVHLWDGTKELCHHKEMRRLSVREVKRMQRCIGCQESTEQQTAK
jgi:hypothetical protein